MGKLHMSRRDFVKVSVVTEAQRSGSLRDG